MALIAISCIIICSESVEELSAGTGQPFSEEAKDNPVTSCVIIVRLKG